MNYISKYVSPIGTITLSSNGKSLNGLWIEGQKHHGIIKEAVSSNSLEVFCKTKEWLNQYFNGRNLPISQLDLEPSGSEFRKQVWSILCKIPYGQVVSYKQIAQQMSDAKMSCQAIGGAVGHNPISIIIPCHRVIGSNGSLTGYAAGINKKLHLLNLEGVNTKKLFAPKGT